MNVGPTVFSVRIGENECLDIKTESSPQDTTVVLKCTTPAPTGSTDKPFPVSVAMTSAGLARSDEAVYWYINQWSANTTWGGALPPFEGDSVVVPAGVTIQLDISPPRLKALILEGTLEVDPSADDIRLDAEYIIINGGALQVIALVRHHVPSLPNLDDIHWMTPTFHCKNGASYRWEPKRSHMQAVLRLPFTAGPSLLSCPCTVPRSSPSVKENCSFLAPPSARRGPTLTAQCIQGRQSSSYPPQWTGFQGTLL